MDREEKKLIEEIRKGLHDFEIPYEEGNWEIFQQSYEAYFGDGRKKRRKGPLVPWKYISAAAVLIGVMMAIPRDKVEKNKVRDDAATEQLTTTSKHEGSDVMGNSDMEPIASPRSELSGNTVQKHPTADAEIDDKVDIRPKNKEIRSTLSRLSGNQLAEKPVVQPIYREKEATSSSRQEHAIATVDRNKVEVPTSDRWKFGIEVSSSIRTDRPNIAAGILTQFELTEKVKLSTGLSYAHISAIHDVDPVQLSYDTKMIGGESMIKALDIPLTVIYAPTDKWYASVGVSALAVLDESKIYRMESEALRENVVKDPESGTSITVFEVVKNEFSEKSLDTDFEGRSNLRYLNLSFGRKQRFNKHTDLLFEPFVKIPMGGLHRGNINLTNTGIKVKVLF